MSGAKFSPCPIAAGSTSVASPRVGMTVSANGANNGILWETTASSNTPNGTLHAFDATNLLNELWNSDMNPDRDNPGAFVKFVNPTVANGKVFLATSSGSLAVYGVLSTEGRQTPKPLIAAVSNAASYSEDAISRGEVVAIFGSALAAVNPPVETPGVHPLASEGTVVLFDGIPSAVLYASANQINAVVPFELSSPSVGVQVQSRGQLSEAFIMTVAPSSPGIFSADGSGFGQGLIFNEDGTANSKDNPAPAGSVIAVYVTGAGPPLPAGPVGAPLSASKLSRLTLPIAARTGGEPAKVLESGSVPGMVVGVIQMKVRTSMAAPLGSSVPLVVQVGDQSSQPGVTLAIR
jgi:uncharacterized protein (TIGR03437 family)